MIFVIPADAHIQRYLHFLHPGHAIPE